MYRYQESSADSTQNAQTSEYNQESSDMKFENAEILSKSFKIDTLNIKGKYSLLRS